jgi:hypothetical protein
MRRVVFNNSILHRIKATPHFIYTFSEDALRQTHQEVAPTMIVHHGAGAAPAGYCEVYAHQEGLTLFASREAEICDLTTQSIAALFSGRIRNWKQLGGNDVPVAIGIRTDGIFGQATQAIMRQHALPMPTHFVNSESYADLVSFATRRPGALIVGLRGALANRSLLTELRVDGALISQFSEPPYPLSLRLSVLVRQDDPLAAELVRDFVDSFVVNAREDGMEAEAVGALALWQAKLGLLESQQRHVAFAS